MKSAVKRLKNKVKYIMILIAVLGLNTSCNKVNVTKQSIDKQELYNSYILKQRHYFRLQYSRKKI